MYRGLRRAATLFLFFLAVWLSMQYFLPLVLPFLLGTALALAAEPMVALLHCRGRLPRGAAAGIGVTLVFLSFALIFLLVLALIFRELGLLAGMLPNLEAAAEDGLSTLSAWALGVISRLPAGIRDLLSRNISEFFSGSSDLLDQGFRYALSLTKGVLSHVPDSAFILGTGILSGYMISIRLPRIKDWLNRKISPQRLQKYLRTLGCMKVALAGWLKAQVKLMGITFLILTMGFVLLRIPYAPAWAALVALVDAFPVLGVGTALLPWSLVRFLQGDPAQAIGLLGIYAAASLTRSILEPKFLGEHLGLDPLLTLAAIYAGYRIWGRGGMLLAPMLAMVAAQIIRAPAQSENSQQKAP